VRALDQPFLNYSVLMDKGENLTDENSSLNPAFHDSIIRLDPVLANFYFAAQCRRLLYYTSHDPNDPYTYCNYCALNRSFYKDNLFIESYEHWVNFEPDFPLTLCDICGQPVCRARPSDCCPSCSKEAWEFLIEMLAEEINIFQHSEFPGSFIEQEYRRVRVTYDILDTGISGVQIS